MDVMATTTARATFPTAMPPIIDHVEHNPILRTDKRLPLPSVGVPRDRRAANGSDRERVPCREASGSQ